MKKFAVLILSLAFIFIPFSAAYAASGVYDNAGLLYETELNAVSEELAALSEATGWDAAAVTVSDTEGKSSAVYADDFYSGLGYGDNGIIYLIDMDNREIYISTIGTASECLTDIRLENIFDTAAGYAAQGSYYRAFSAEIEMSLEYFKAGIPVDTGQAAAHIAVWITAFLVGAVSAACFAIHIYKAYSFKEIGEIYDYGANSRTNFTVNSDRLVNSFITTRIRPRRRQNNRPPSGRRPRASTGRRMRGRGRKF